METLDPNKSVVHRSIQRSLLASEKYVINYAPNEGEQVCAALVGDLYVSPGIFWPY